MSKAQTKTTNLNTKGKVKTKSKQFQNSRANGPVVRNTTSTSVVVSGKDVIHTLMTKDEDFNLISGISVNPFAWGSTRIRDQSMLYQNYAIKSLQLEFTPNFSFDTTGTLYVGMFTIDNHPTDIGAMCNTTSSGSTSIREHHTFTFDLDTTNLQQRYKVYGKLSDTDANPQIIFLATSKILQRGTVYQGTVGTITMHYTYEFTNPCRRRANPDDVLLMEDLSEIDSRFSGSLMALSNTEWPIVDEYANSPKEEKVLVERGQIIEARNGVLYTDGFKLSGKPDIPALALGKSNTPSDSQGLIEELRARITTLETENSSLRTERDALRRSNEQLTTMYSNLATRFNTYVTDYLENFQYQIGKDLDSMMSSFRADGGYPENIVFKNSSSSSMSVGAGRYYIFKEVNIDGKPFAAWWYERNTNTIPAGCWAIDYDYEPDAPLTFKFCTIKTTNDPNSPNVHRPYGMAPLQMASDTPVPVSPNFSS